MMESSFLRVGRSCIVLALVAGLTTGCMTRRLNKVTAPSRWPPGQTTKANVALDINVVMPGTSDNEIWAFVPGTHTDKVVREKFAASMHRVITQGFSESGLFASTTEVTSNATTSTDLKATVELRVVNKRPFIGHIGAFNVFALCLIPIRHNKGYFDMTTTVTKPSGAVVDVVKLTEEHEAWFQIFLVLFGQTAGDRSRLAEEIARDLTRATLSKMAPSIKAETSGTGQFF